MSAIAIKQTIIIAHTLFWIIVAIRMALSYYRNSKLVQLPPTPVSSDKPSPASPWYGLIFYTVFTFLYYLLVGLWWVNPNLAGPLILPLTVPVGILGITFIIIGLLIMVWAYTYLNSFRFLAKIEAGHELATSGPYKFLRHPVYSGMSFFNIGCFLVLPSLGFLIILVGLLAGSAIRATSEEKALIGTFGIKYQDYMKKTYRLIPFVY